MNNVDYMLYKLSKSKFRSSFHLRKYMIDYINNKGIDVIKDHTKDFINQKIGPAFPKNDGKQTPTKNHPSFIAMHACACCCRSCLEKWHHIEKGRALTSAEKEYLTNLVMEWIVQELKRNEKDLHNIKH